MDTDKVTRESIRAHKLSKAMVRAMEDMRRFSRSTAHTLTLCALEDRGLVRWGRLTDAGRACFPQVTVNITGGYSAAELKALSH